MEAPTFRDRCACADPSPEQLDLRAADGMAGGRHGHGDLVGKGDDLEEAAHFRFSRNDPVSGTREFCERVGRIKGWHVTEAIAAMTVDAVALEHGLHAGKGARLRRISRR